MKDFPVGEQPTERLLEHGAQNLTDAELIAVIIRTGNRKETAIDLSQKLLKGANGLYGLRFLLEASNEELSKTKGIGPVKIAQIKAALEIGKRLFPIKETEPNTIKSPEDVAYLLMNEMRYLDKEHFKAVLLNTKNHVLSIEDISVGNLNASIVHPREVFKTAIRRSSGSVILVHNHPSGDPTPSKEDINVTKRIVESGELLGIPVLDHIIIGDGTFTSLKGKNLI
ncbi:MAG TPA: DNA repair protein RadC [Thermoanaerobacterales bacterium]|nr:DNA repair protein RadC [Thermoanaerobacterales bacterium]